MCPRKNSELDEFSVLRLDESKNISSPFAQRVVRGIVLSSERPQDCHFRFKYTGKKVEVTISKKIMEDQSDLAERGGGEALSLHVVILYALHCFHCIYFSTKCHLL